MPPAKKLATFSFCQTASSFLTQITIFVSNCMATTRSTADAPNLERFCAPSPRAPSFCAPARGDWLRIGKTCGPFERFEAFFGGHAYDPHKHDTYALGYTVSGHQFFRYRGVRQVSLTAHTIVVHPDETHDGEAGAMGGFRYRMAYLAPETLASAMAEGSPRILPFVREAVTQDRELLRVLVDLLGDLDEALDDLRVATLLSALADCLQRMGGSAPKRMRKLDLPRLRRAAELLSATRESIVTAADLEAATGLDRFTLARQFRQAFGTSPDRYRILRQLDRARQSIVDGRALAEAANDAGFADQAHFHRHFRRTYGMSPGRYRRLCAAD